MMQRPPGDPATLLQQAASLTSADLSGANSLLDSAKRLQSITSGTSDWNSAGATAFRSSVSSFGTALNALGQHVQDFATALTQYATKLQQFQQDWDQLNADRASKRGAVQQLFASMQQQVNTPWLVPVGYSGPRHPLSSDLPNFNTSDEAMVDGTCASQVSNQSCGVWADGTKTQCEELAVGIQNMDMQWNQLEQAYTSFIKAAPAMFAIDSSPATMRIADMISSAELAIDTPMAFDPRAGDPAIPLMEFSTVRIVVQPGDNLTAIAQEFYGTSDWQKVYANQSVSSQDGNPNLIYPGQNFTLDNTTPPSNSTATVALAVAGVRLDAPLPPAAPAAPPAAPAPVPAPNVYPSGPPAGTYADGSPVVTEPVCMTASGWANAYANAAASGKNGGVYVTGNSGKVYELYSDGHGGVSVAVRPSADFVGPIAASMTGSPADVAAFIAGDLPTR